MDAADDKLRNDDDVSVARRSTTLRVLGAHASRRVDVAGDERDDDGSGGSVVDKYDSVGARGQRRRIGSRVDVDDERRCCARIAEQQRCEL